MRSIRAALLGLLALFGGAGIAFAQEAPSVGPSPWRAGFQEAATPVAQEMHAFHDLLLYIITAITIFVLLLLVWVAYRYNEKRNPKPSQTTHNTVIEVLWTVVPVIILVIIAIPSFKLLYATDASEDAEMTVKVYGNTWNWTYEYPDHGNFSFTANIVQDADLQPGQPRLLTTDIVAVIPADTKVRFIVTSNDTLHSFAMPSWGVKIDAVPGRLNETWAEVPGSYAGTIFYGQCSELCGVGHAYMPIAIRVVTKEEFATWAEQAQQEYGALEGAPADRQLAGR